MEEEGAAQETYSEEVFSTDEVEDKEIPVETKLKPCISVNPAEVKFGCAKIGQMAMIPLEIKSCGLVPLIIEDISMEGVKDFSAGPLTVPKVLNPKESMIIDLAYSPVDEIQSPDKPDKAQLVIKKSSPYEEIVVNIEGGICEDCPIPVIEIKEGFEVVPQTLLHLIGDKSVAKTGEITTYEWKAEQPPLSKSSFMPSASFPNPNFEVNVAGTYVFCLDVCDFAKCSDSPGCMTTECKEATVIPDCALHIELT